MCKNLATWSKRSVVAALVMVAGVLNGCANAPSDRTPIWLGQIFPNGPVLYAQPVSWKAMKFETLVRQESDFSCGAAVIATIFNYAFGHKTTERQVLVNMLKVSDPDVVRKKGFSLLEMKNYSNSIGMHAEGYRVNYDKLAQINIPSIVLIEVRGYKHFVVVRKIFGERIAIGDPALGNYTMHRSNFEQSWNGIVFVVSGAGYIPDNLLLNPPSPLSAHALLATSANMPPAQAAEFGYSTGYDFSF